MSASHALQFSTRSILLASLTVTLPALVMLLVIGVADLTLDGSTVTIIVICAVAGMFAGDALIARTAGGAARRGTYEHVLDTLDEIEHRARRAARYLPLVVAICVALVTGTEVGGVALCLVVAFPVAQAAFAVWLHARRDEFSTASTS